MSKNVTDHSEAIHIAPQLLTVGLIKFFSKNCPKKISPNIHGLTHKNLKNLPNSYKIAPKCPKMSRIIVRLYILLHNSLGGSYKVFFKKLSEKYFIK